jgi:hypothetical protein
MHYKSNRLATDNTRRLRSDGPFLQNTGQIDGGGDSLGPFNNGHKPGWGGARNRADRVSWHLSRVQAEKVLMAARVAELTGLRFNRHWTVHYERAGISECDGARFIGHLLKLASAQARRDGGQMAAIWVRENGEGKGGHVHIMLHLPAGTHLRNRTRRWIVAAGGKYRAKVSRVNGIGGRLSFAELGGDPMSDLHYRANAEAVLRYLLKYADLGAGEALGLARFGEAGRVVGKRAGCTQNLARRQIERVASREGYLGTIGSAHRSG